jgi:hypothetical protein
VESYVLSNVVVGGFFLCGVVAFRSLGRTPLWSHAARELARRRPVALGAVLVFVAIGLLDSLAWVGGSDLDGIDTTLAHHQPRSVIDRIFPVDFDERSYSAPLASVEFYGDAPLAHPGAHWLGTDILAVPIRL